MRLGTGILLACVLALVTACAWQPGGGDAVAADAGAHRENGSDYVAQIGRWRAHRVSELESPQGWLTLTGSGRLHPGRYRVGTSADNDVTLPNGPPRLGTLRISAEGDVVFAAAAGANVTLDGRPVGVVSLRVGDIDHHGDRLKFGGYEFYLVRTGPMFGWRFRDPNSPLLKEFSGLEYFPVNWGWRIKAEWHPYLRPKPITLLTSIGTPLELHIPGEAVFYRDGHRFRLYPLLDPEDPARLVVVFADRTSGKETYGGARYLSLRPDDNGRVILDFNKAVNPPCAMTPHVVCPIAPPENRLDIAVAAGEKTYLSSR